VRALSRADTAKLLREGRRAFAANGQELLLTAFARALAARCGRDRLAVALEGHGRDAFGSGLNLDDAIGWFTAIYPVAFDLNPDGDPAEDLKTVKEQLRRVPHGGASFAALRRYDPTAETRAKLAAASTDVAFNFLGELGGDLFGDRFSVDPGPRGAETDPDHALPHALVFEAIVLDGALEASLHWRAGAFEAGDMDALMDAWTAEVRALTAACAARRETELTPADFTFDGLNRESFAAICRGAGMRPAEVEDVCPPAPTQAGILFHALYQPDASAYFQQIRFVIEGAFDANLFRAGWNRLFARHAALRALFVYGAGERPLQLILKRREGPFEIEDLRNLDEGARRARLEDWLRADEARGFNLGVDAPLRLKLFQLADDRWQAVWSMHHIALDGWSVGLLLSDLLGFYAERKRGETLSLTPAPSYARYLRWLGEQNPDTALAFWRERLEGFDRPTPLPRPARAVADGYIQAESTWRLNAAQTEAVRQLARDRGVTVNHVVQAVWALLLQRWHNRDEALFGSVVSGRPAELAGVEEIVGLFINIVPVRVATRDGQTFADLLGDLARQGAEAKAHEHAALADIQNQSPLKRALLDHYIAFENFPLEDRVANPENGDGLGFACRDIHMAAHSTYDFFVRVSPDPCLLVELVYNQAAFSAGYVDGVRDQLRALTEAALRDPDQTLGALKGALADGQQSARKRKKLDLFKKAKPKKAPAKPLVSLTPPADGETGPALVAPNRDDVDLASWLADRRDWIDEQLHRHGGLLFRGFRLESAEQFDALAAGFLRQPMDYVDQSSPRHKVAPRVYTSTDHPADQKIQMHNELSYSHNWPMRLLFFCELAPEWGGETPLADSRRVLALLDEKVRAKFAEKGVQYRRRYTEELGLNWRRVYQTEDRAVAERYLRERGVAWDWEDDGALTVRYSRPAVQTHPITGEETWFNHGWFFHAVNLDPAVRQALPREKWPFETAYGDGEPIPDEDALAIGRAFAAAQKATPWRRGDLVILDNMLMAHGRNAFGGERQVRVAMGEPHHAKLPQEAAS